MGISVVEWARREGISKVAAYKRINTGKVRRLPDGTIDPEQAAADWAKNKDAVRALQAGRHRVPKVDPEPTSPPPPVAMPVPAPVTPSKTAEGQVGTSFSDLQRAEKALKIKRDQLKFRREESKVVDIDEVRRAWSDMILRARNVLLPIGGELADVLASETDPLRCRELIDRRIFQSLSILSGQQNA